MLLIANTVFRQTWLFQSLLTEQKQNKHAKLDISLGHQKICILSVCFNVGIAACFYTCKLLWSTPLWRGKAGYNLLIDE